MTAVYIDSLDKIPDREVGPGAGHSSGGPAPTRGKHDDDKRAEPAASQTALSAARPANDVLHNASVTRLSAAIVPTDYPPTAAPLNNGLLVSTRRRGGGSIKTKKNKKQRASRHQVTAFQKVTKCSTQKKRGKQTSAFKVFSDCQFRFRLLAAAGPSIQSRTSLAATCHSFDERAPKVVKSAGSARPPQNTTATRNSCTQLEKR